GSRPCSATIHTAHPTGQFRRRLRRHPTIDGGGRKITKPKACQNPNRAGGALEGEHRVPRMLKLLSRRDSSSGVFSLYNLAAVPSRKRTVAKNTSAKNREHP